MGDNGTISWISNRHKPPLKDLQITSHPLSISNTILGMNSIKLLLMLIEMVKSTELLSHQFMALHLDSTRILRQSLNYHMFRIFHQSKKPIISVPVMRPAQLSHSLPIQQLISHQLVPSATH